MPVRKSTENVALEPSPDLSTSDFAQHARIGLLRRALQLRHYALAVTDQGVVSGSNFALNVLLARWLPTDMYGAYVIVLSVFFLLANIHNALVLEPFTVLDSSQSRAGDSKYRTAVCYVNTIICGAFTGVLAIATTVVHVCGGRPELVGALAGLTVAVSSVLAFWLARCMAYVSFLPHRATAGSGMYAIIVLLGAAATAHAGVLTPFLTFALMAVAAICATCLMWMLAATPTHTSGAGSITGAVITMHWRYGRWVLATNGAAWGAVNGVQALSAIFIGMQAAGAFGAISNFLLPVAHIFGGLSRVFLPRLSKVSSENGLGDMAAPVRSFRKAVLAGGAAYVALLFVFHRPIADLLYSGKFADSTWLVPWAGIYAALYAVGASTDVGLRAARAPEAVFQANMASTGVALAAAAIGIPVFGLPAAVGALVLGAVTNIIVSSRLFFTTVRRTQVFSPPEAHVAAHR